MIRKLLTVVLPLVLPFLVYWVYLALARRKARLAGEGRLPGWQDAPWTWIIASGGMLMIAALVTVRLTSGVEPGVKLEPPRLIEGEVEPSRPIE